MNDKSFIRFLGTAGARYVVSKQLRASGGIFISLNGINIIIDPGPGSLVRLSKSKPPFDITELDGIILTHSHIDHSNDVNILIDGMTTGGIKKRGFLFAPDDCLNGENSVVFNYLRGFLDDIFILEPEKHYEINNIQFTTSLRHFHPVETYGIMFHYNGKKISYMTDTRYFPELTECYKNSDILIMNVVRYLPFTNNDILHLSFHDIREILERTKPKSVFLTHFGLTMLKAEPSKITRTLSKESGFDVKAARDGMVIEF